VTKATVSRRAMLGTISGALAGSVGIAPFACAHAQATLAPESEKTIRKWYAAWEQTHWRPVDALLADDFTFTSAAGDDHISKSAFKTKCWETQINYIERFDLLRVFGSGDEAFVMYVCRTKNGNSFRNVEYIRAKNEKVQAIECYFGAQDSFPSAVSSGKG
jgi:ketosteroid isomerase-like protein